MNDLVKYVHFTKILWTRANVCHEVGLG